MPEPDLNRMLPGRGPPLVYRSLFADYVRDCHSKCRFCPEDVLGCPEDILSVALGMSCHWPPVELVSSPVYFVILMLG